jgi:membrane-associated protease RseP (regulator of RpoE activity)
LYIFRKRFEKQGKLVFLYKTKWGIKLMDKIGQKHSSFIQKVSFVGIIIGYLGMVLIVFFLLYGLYQILFVPNAPPPIQPVIPGVPIPGSPIMVPLIVGWIALFLSAVIHEFSHGVVARAYNIKVKSSGFAFIGPLGAAFVEPDENQVKKSKKKVQNSIFAAGPFSNVLLAALMFLILIFALTPALNAYLEPDGVRFQSVQDKYPAQEAGVKTGVVYTVVNGQQINTSTELLHALENITPNETVYLGTNTQIFAIRATTNPQNESKGYIGVIGPETHFTNDKTVLAVVLLWIYELFNWTFLISLGLGLANLMPLGPVDGGRLFQTASEKFFGKKKGAKVWGIVTIIFIALLIVLFLPILKATGLAILRGLRIIP